MKVAVLGGTGSFGKAVARRLHEAGEDVLIGSRDAARAQDAAAELGVNGGTNAVVARAADVVVLAVKADAAVSTAAELRDALGSTPLLCVASELRFTGGQAVPSTEQGSVAERVAGAVSAPVVAGLHSLAARTLAAERPDEDALVCGDDAEAKRLALELAQKLVGGRALDAGPLSAARALEGLTAVIVNLNRRYKGHAGIRVTGLPE